MALVQTFLYFISFRLIFALHGTNIDPCNNYQSINNPYRSTKYQVSPGEVLICDSKLTPGWYRFTSIVGGMMPTTKPQIQHCGTVAPIWMRGTHPTTKGQVTQATACTNFNNRRNGCVFSFRMSVKHCGDFFVYDLKPSRGCAMAYCADSLCSGDLGDLMPCPKGQTGVSPNCTTSVITPFPYRLVPTPTVTYLDNGKPQVTMLCKFQFPLWKNVSFFVQWFTDGHLSKNHTICDNQDPEGEGPVCPIRQSELGDGGFQAGHRVRCRLRMRYTTNIENKWTALWRDSNEYFVGIEVNPTHAIVKECEPDKMVTVTFRPTVPVNPDDFHNFGYVAVKIYVPDVFKGKNRQSAIDTCNLKLRTTDIKDGQKLKIKGICDNQNDPRTVLEYHFAIENSHSFWGFYRVPSVTVTIDNTQQNQCSSTGDPHYTTFDGRYYDFYHPGDYVLYSNKERKFEVHTRLWRCWSVTCNCGVAIREGNDVIVITVCNPELRTQPTLLRTKIRSTGQLARGTHIYKKVDGSTITHNVVLPSGTRVKAIRYSWGLNIFLQAPKRDARRTKGLCGNFNGDKNDDFNKGGDGQAYTDPTAFADSWRVTPDKSYFEVLPPKEQVEETGRSCFCPTKKNMDKISATTCQDNANRFHDFGPDPGEDIVTQVQVSNKRRSIQDQHYTDDIMDYEDRSFFVDDDDANDAVMRMRVRRDVSSSFPKENATQYCKSVIEESTAGKTCVDIPGFNVTTAMQQCVTDLQITGDKMFAGSAFDAMKAKCEEVALNNISLFTEDEDGELKPPAEIGDNLCPGDCSNHGNCTNRTCICEEGYTSADCSMLVNAVPELLGIYDGGMCDIRTRPCKKTDIFGQDFISSENVTSHVQEFKVVPSSWKPKPHLLKYPGKMIDIFGVRCNLPDPPTKLGDYGNEGTPAGGLLISISNDGEHKSQRQMRFVSYDSVCMVCNKSSNCTLKDNSCLINGHCFAANQPNPRDWCQQCMPGESQSSWTRRKVNHPPQFVRNQSTRYAIQGEYLPLQLQATDPENRPITYSLISTSATGYTFSSTGLLKWNVTSQDNKQFVFKVTDECNASDTMTITIRILSCPCQNGGKCLPHPYHPRGYGQYYCTCPRGITGDRCETNIDDCVSINCGNGTCVDGVNNYTCRCHVGFTGSLCDQRLTRCTNQTCFPGVTCTEISNGISCGPCPVGFSGDGKTCVAPPTTGQPTTILTTTEAQTTTEQPTTPTARVTTQSTTTSTPERTTNQARTTAEQQTTTTAMTPTEDTQTTATEPRITSSAQHTTEQGETTSKEPKPTETPETKSTMEPEPTTEYEEEMVIKAEIRIMVEWNEDYKNKKSQAYRVFADGLAKEIWNMYAKAKNGDELQNVIIISLNNSSISSLVSSLKHVSGKAAILNFLYSPFIKIRRPGSVLAEFKLVFKKQRTDPLAPLKENVQNGKLGPWTVDPVSLKVIKENKETPSTKDNRIVIVVVVVGVLFAVITAALVIIVCRKNRQKYHLKRRVTVLELPEEDSRQGDARDRYEMETAWKSCEQKDKELSAKENPGFDQLH